MSVENENQVQKPQASVRGNEASRRGFAFDRVNFILLAVSFAIVVIGFILMSGSSSAEEAYNPEIFSAMRIKVAPVVCFVGFVSMIYAIMRKPKD